MVLRGDDQEAWISIGAAAVIMILRAARTLNTGRLIRSGSKSAGG
jgi:hypothetical protein